MLKARAERGKTDPAGLRQAHLPTGLGLRPGVLRVCPLGDT